ncbi:MAG TPA: hypothetical protein VG733_11745 [Chthoniobacteraceae bacterium]|nr:hypothetical protein [Chthoniobacteraceae bacterium]
METNDTNAEVHSDDGEKKHGSHVAGAAAGLAGIALIVVLLVLPGFPAAGFSQL